jgi:hypothetical protein
MAIGFHPQPWRAHRLLQRSARCSALESAGRRPSRAIFRMLLHTRLAGCGLQKLAGAPMQVQNVARWH